MSTALPSPREAALAGLLHDIGKLAQRAHPNEQALRAAYQGQDFDGLQASILPSGEHGRYTHRHALWTDFFFETARARWPEGLDAQRLRGAAIRHHKPVDPADWIIAEADRLASGLERKKRDEEAELRATDQAMTFREMELTAQVPRLAIGLGDAIGTPLRHPAEEISADGLVPKPPSPAEQPRRLGVLWQAWLEGWNAVAQYHGLSADRFEQALLGLSERLLWAVVSSTVDQPDVSLHDHGRAVAAIAAALAAWHAAHGEDSVAAVKDRKRPKFRLVALDLSGIQTALLRLAGAKGASRILRARSLLMDWTVEAALHLLLERLGLPRSSVLLDAGGKAEVLAADLPDLEVRLAALREELDAHMIAEWQGDLALMLAAGPPFAAEQFLRRGQKGEVAEGYREERAKLAAALDAAKLRPFAGWRDAVGWIGTGVIPAPFVRAEGACASCGVRPAVTELDRAARCRICDAAYRLGQRLPHAEGIALLSRDAEAQDALAVLPGGLRLAPWVERGAQALTSVTFKRQDAGSAVFRPAAHVPCAKNPEDERYRHAGIAEEDRGQIGDLMSFAEIAAEALEKTAQGIRGRNLLGILKADVDRLGQIFGRGLGDDRSPARIAQLSRLMDGYFAERLPWLLARDFPTTYTVYAGGDDLLLVVPWRFALPLALHLREDFGAFAGGNPNLSLSAGIAFVHPHHPIALAAAEAAAMLELAKDAGRNRLGLFGRVLSWSKVKATLKLAEALHEAVRNETLPPTFLHRMRGFVAMRGRIGTTEERVGDRGWAAKWGYHRARFLDRAKVDGCAALEALLDRTVPPPTVSSDADPEIAITIALWRNR